jgi:hypothetical protein
MEGLDPKPSCRIFSYYLSHIFSHCIFIESSRYFIHLCQIKNVLPKSEKFHCFSSIFSLFQHLVSIVFTSKSKFGKKKFCYSVYNPRESFICLYLMIKNIEITIER